MLVPEMAKPWEFPFPRISFPFPEFPNFWEYCKIPKKISIPIPTHSHGNIAIPMGFPNSQKFPTFQKKFNDKFFPCDKIITHTVWVPPTLLPG